MRAVDPHIPSRGADLLMEHVNSLDPGDYPQRPAARERLERIVGGALARLLVGALSGGRRARRHGLD
jgi:hypothetical protein